MNDQPKPAKDQNPSREEIYDEMTSRIKGDKLGSGEWTAETVARFATQQPGTWQSVADAHNASLAAKQEELATLKRDYVQLDEIKSKLRDQLAAEQKNTHQALELLRKEAQAGARASEIIAALADDKKRLDWLCGPGKYTDWNDLDLTNPLTFRDSIDAELRSAPRRSQDGLRNA